MEAFVGFFTNIKDGVFGFETVINAIVNLYYSIAQNSTVRFIWDWLANLLGDHAALICTLLAMFCVSVAFFGQKMMGFLRCVAFFIAGFGLGVELLAPLIPQEIQIPAWVVGLVVAIVAAVLSRFIYYGVYAVVGLYGVYMLSYNGFYIPGFEVTKGNHIVSMIIAVVIVVLLFIFRRYVEMALTAGLGGWFSTVLIGCFVYDFAAWPIFGGRWWVAFMSVGLIIAIPGMIVQVITRKTVVSILLHGRNTKAWKVCTISIMAYITTKRRRNTRKAP